MSSGEDGSSGPEKSVGVARPPEIAPHSVTAVITAAAKSVGEDRASGIAKCSATQKVGVPVPHVKDEKLEVSRTPRELQRLTAQQGCFVALVMIESHHDIFPIAVSCGVPDATPLGPFTPRRKERAEPPEGGGQALEWIGWLCCWKGCWNLWDRRCVWMDMKDMRLQAELPKGTSVWRNGDPF